MKHLARHGLHDGAFLAMKEAAFYKPYGEKTPRVLNLATTPENKGWIGQRFDAEAGLQYLNARYYDPEMGMFLQPDWFEVTKPGVGTNRFGYGLGDPVNLSDPGGNYARAENKHEPGERPDDEKMAKQDRIVQNFGLGKGNNRLENPSPFKDMGGGGGAKGNLGSKSLDKGTKTDAGRASSRRDTNGLYDDSTKATRGGTYTLRDDANGGKVVRNGRTKDHKSRERDHARDLELREYRYNAETRTDKYDAQ